MRQDKLGVFSKLLEGLLRNSKTRPPGARQIAETEDPSLLPGEAPEGDGENASIKKTNPRWVKKAPLSPGDEQLRKKETPVLLVQEALPGEKVGLFPLEQTEEGQDTTAEAAAFAAAFSLFPQTDPGEVPPQETGPEDFPPPSGEFTVETPVLFAEIKPPGPQSAGGPEGLEEDASPRDRKAAAARRDPGEASLRLTGETEAAAVRLARTVEKPSGEAEKTGPANSRRNDPGLRDKRRDRVELEVRDQRTAPEVPLARGPALPGEAPGTIREVELRLELPGGGRAVGEGLSTGGSAPSRAFEEILAGELRGGLGDDIVQQASIILKDGGAGLIRLTLKPESLGNVKIRLEMAENKIAGRIIVESNEALRAFEREIASLEQALKDSGFNGASIELSVSSDNGGDRGNPQGKGEEASPFFSERLHLAVSGYESAGDLLAISGSPGDPAASGPVNMLV
jgi:hypothetical protein